MITATIMAVFAIIQLMLGIGLGYYWNGLQGQLSGVGDMQTAGRTGNIWGDILVYLLVFAPVALLAFFSPTPSHRTNFRYILVLPLLVYLSSAILEIRSILPLGEHFKDIYVALDNIIYVPFIICFLLLSIYYVLVLTLPKLLGTRAVGVLTMIVAIAFYIMNGFYIIYLHVMGMLAGDFGTMQFILYLVCFAFDAATFFLALSVLMTYCAMHRETVLTLKEAQKEAKAVWAEKETARDGAQVSFEDVKIVEKEQAKSEKKE
jgi:hypothetical protein